MVSRAAGADLDRPTLYGWDLRELVNHFAGTTGALTRVGARQPLDPVDPWGGSTGQELPVSAELAAQVYESVAAPADLGRQIGAYSPPVGVAANASDLARALGATGRDPAWRG